MKKSSKVKYFGVAAAALLAVAPVVAPAVSATTNAPATVQAATTGTPAFIPEVVTTAAAGSDAFAQIKDATVAVTLDGGVNLAGKTPTLQTLTITTPGGAGDADGKLQEAVDTAKADVTTKQTALTTAQTALADDKTGDPDGELQKAVDAAQTDLDTANEAVTTAQAALDAATAETSAKNVTGYYYTVQAPVSDANGAKYTTTAYIPAEGYNLKYAASFNVGSETADADAATAINTETGAAATGSNLKGISKALENGTLSITGVYTDANKAEYYSFTYGGSVYLIPTTNLNITAGNTVTDVTGLITTKKDDVKTYSDSSLNTYTGTLIRDKGTQLLVDQTATDSKGNVVAYHVSADSDTAAGLWVKADDVTFTDSVLTSEAVNGSVVANAEVPTYNDKAATKESKNTLASGEKVNFTRVVKNSVTGEVVSYGFKNADGVYEYVKASDVTVSNVTTSKLPTGTAVYSNYKGATIYSDAAATKDSGAKLSTDVNEWAAYETSKDADGNIVAYRLGANQWVKAADLELQQDLDGTFDVAAGVTMYSVDGEKTGTIENGGDYKVFAVRYINGKQSLKLGTDNQWVVASQGEFYPA